jgi:uncharacterized protein YecE (DUF72 family)
MIYIGCCGFPIGMKRYFKKFKTVEIQTTFYRIQKDKTVKRWCEEAPKDFIFNIKVFQGITHPIKSPTWRRSGLKEEELNKLGNKVGFLRPTREVFNFWNLMISYARILNTKVLLIQLPASFKDSKENWDNAERFFRKAKREKFEIAIELRKWDKKRTEKFCKKFKLIDCCDPFVRMPTYLGKSKIAYLRLHGSPPGKKMYNYKYNSEDLRELKMKLDGIKARKIFILFNNIHMKQDALRFMRMIK